MTDLKALRAIAEAELACTDDYGRLTFVSEVPRDAKGFRMWLMRCACGTEKSIRKSNITSGSIKSCGCGHSFSA